MVNCLQDGWSRRGHPPAVVVEGDWALLTCTPDREGPTGGRDRLQLIKLDTLDTLHRTNKKQVCLTTVSASSFAKVLQWCALMQFHAFVCKQNIIPDHNRTAQVQVGSQSTLCKCGHWTAQVSCTAEVRFTVSGGAFCYAVQCAGQLYSRLYSSLYCWCITCKAHAAFTMHPVWGTDECSSP